MFSNFHTALVIKGFLSEWRGRGAEAESRESVSWVPAWQHLCFILPTCQLDTLMTTLRVGGLRRTLISGSHGMLDCEDGQELRDQ